MSITLNKFPIIVEIEKALNKYERIFIFDSADQQVKVLLDNFCRKILSTDCARKILIFANGYILEDINEVFKSITSEEYWEILEIYSMYEFSDCIQFVSKSSQYGTILNYLSMGLMTEEEFFEALLY